MNVLKSLLQPCYAVVMLISVVLFSPSICTANNNRLLSKLDNEVELCYKNLIWSNNEIRSY
ncbi:hypothetical protein [Orientia tsutsugamushi]|uniref:hypothetical protein n=1 Tax=Orientia tsutsugamushi TaxID=784 RepID=UPI00031214A8|nr:hypothetical protein [Orientia tsutsugamushi]